MFKSKQNANLFTKHTLGTEIFALDWKRLETRVIIKISTYPWWSVNFEMSFWCLQFFQKTNKNNSTWGTIVVRSIFFVHFLEEFRIPTTPFEINWPLKAMLQNTNFRLMNLSLCTFYFMRVCKEPAERLSIKRTFKKLACSNSR